MFLTTELCIEIASVQCGQLFAYSTVRNKKMCILNEVMVLEKKSVKRNVFISIYLSYTCTSRSIPEGVAERIKYSS
jgi:hypothetical protein